MKMKKKKKEKERKMKEKKKNFPANYQPTKKFNIFVNKKHMFPIKFFVQKNYKLLWEQVLPLLKILNQILVLQFLFLFFVEKSDFYL